LRNRLALVVAVVLGLIAMYGVHQYIAKREQQFRKKFQTVRVAAAAQRIKAGQVIRPQMLLEGGLEVPEAAVTADHMLVSEQDRLIGQTINRTVERGEPLLASYFRRPVERLENKLQPGQRALTLRVDAITGVGGNLAPGCRVDILGTFPVASDRRAASTSAAATKTVLLFSDVAVLAVDNRTREDRYIAPGERRRTYQSVTVAVTPEEANILVYAQDYGRLTLALRPPAETLEVSPPPDINCTNILERAARAEKERRERRSKTTPLRVE